MKKWILIIGSIVVLLILGLLIGGKMYMDKQEEKEEKIRQSFDKILAMYPTQNLMDFYDKEGYRDDGFEKEDKGVWVLDSDMNISKGKGLPLVGEGMNLRLNRNTRRGKGFYFHYELSDNGDTEKRYPVTYDSNGIHLVEEVSDSNLKDKIEHFQFFVQYATFAELNNNKPLHTMYNSEVPMYELEYQLTNEDPNVKALRERYDIPTQAAPTLLLKGQGSLDGSSVGYKSIELTFDKKVDVFYSDSIDYQPATMEDNYE